MWPLVAQAVGLQPALGHALLTAAAAARPLQTDVGGCRTVSRMDALLAMDRGSIQRALPAQHGHRAVLLTQHT